MNIASSFCQFGTFFLLVSSPPGRILGGEHGEDPDERREMERKELFALGAIVATPGALRAFEQTADDYSALLDRHQAGDWGEIDPEDRGVNEEALKEGCGSSPSIGSRMAQRSGS